MEEAHRERTTTSGDNGDGPHSSAHNQIMVAPGSLFLLCLTASSYNCRQGYRSDLSRHATPLFGVESSLSSSRSSGPRQEDQIKRSPSSQSAGIEGQIDDGVSSLRLMGWEKRYSLLKRFQEREGHCNVTKSHTEDGIKLGKWVGIQHRLKRSGELDPERQKLLEEIDIAWVLGKPHVPWEERFDLMKQFKKREGHCNVPYLHKEDGAKLGSWVYTQRRFKKMEKIKPYRQKMLDDIGFEWVLVQHGAKMSWEEWFDLFKEFKKREGHCNVPQLHKEDGNNLGIWVFHQRQFKRTEKLDPHRQKILEDIGFEWVLIERRAKIPWEEICSLLKKFKKREGHCNVPQLHKEDGNNLGIWLSNQRRLKKTGKLDPDRQKMLEEVGPEWAGSYTV